MAPEDIVRPGTETSRTVFEQGFRIWTTLRTCAQQEPSLPQTCFQIQDAFQLLPPLVQDVDLKCKHNSLYATGTSIWGTSQGQCKIPVVEKRLELPVSINHSTRLALSESIPNCQKWFQQEENHLSVLILAWSYIFSARWVELIPGAELTYTGKHAEYGNSNGDRQTQVVVDVGDVDNDAARWWAAVLSPDEGWQAYLTWEQRRFRSPWSTALETRVDFTLACHKPLCHVSTTAPPFTTAVRFLAEYCNLHKIVDQALAALSSTLFLPTLNKKETPIPLPIPNCHKKKRLKPAISESSEQKEFDFILTQIVPELDKLLTLSCNSWGLRSLLSSVFYEPEIPCNAVSPWLQSVFAILDSVKDDHLLAHILMNRVPRISFLWLGSIIVGFHKNILQDCRFGLIPVELHAASWCGVTQSFLQAPVSQPLIANGDILRSDECRLLYLTQAEGHSRWPVSPWMPFGTTTLEDTEIEVRLHAQCVDHSLQYSGWHWTCGKGKLLHPMCVESTTFAHPPARHLAISTPIRYEALNLEEESASENATRNIFGWLRIDGYPPRERAISNHEWFNLDESDNESAPLNESPKSHTVPTPKVAVEEWIQQSILIPNAR
ncbi:hypothetical protein LOZ39_001012 [Ophidiomyces ophidiicola]|nr:hypothetical protein LOZ49_002959 [Ophidiomyces ophidiicola]KAI2079706.1 hypothetical protein LOZ39_001012 [Ophidiomyces ophidiicola]KAI2140235.1 hypothetical protein LOZ29_002175 [Ophidiomyces ophidiicola]KAI2142182.1 hypothetical protein LOZ28_002295 [Ophidiomyces ophidiicola]KAI2215693.1 hypothetical protein LOZ15_004420 [Ophidiomyces ophidiicola]